MTTNLDKHLAPAHAGLSGISGAMGNATKSLGMFSRIAGSLQHGVSDISGSIMSRVDSAHALMSYYNIIILL